MAGVQGIGKDFPSLYPSFLSTLLGIEETGLGQKSKFRERLRVWISACRGDGGTFELTVYARPRNDSRHT